MLIQYNYPPEQNSIYLFVIAGLMMRRLLPGNFANLPALNLSYSA